jgi:cold shock CspA family protein
MDAAFLCTTKEVLEHFGVTEEGGLSHSQVVSFEAKYGRNGRTAAALDATAANHA